MLKRIFVLFLILLLCEKSISSVVSDNDGSAFITKAEFDSLKNSFQAQIDTYNSAIDSKIDTAIASYLAGIKTESSTNLENKYTLINPVWMHNKRFNKSKLGTKYTSYISFIEIDTYDNYCCYMMEGTGNAWYVVSDMTYNTSDQEYLYRISNKKIGNFDNEWSLQDLVASNYSVTLVGGASGGRGGAINTVNRLMFGVPTIFTKGSNLYFSTWYDNWPIEVWEVNPTTKAKIANHGNISGTSGSGEDIAISMVSSDIVQNDDTLFYLAGGSISNDIMYCLNNAEVSLLGNRFATTKSNHGSTRQARKNDAGTGVSTPMNWQFRDYGATTIQDYETGIYVEVYRHKIEQINSTDLLNESITQSINERAYYYSGCPLFTATADGKVKFKIKFNNILGYNTKWALKDSSFSNAENPGNATGIENCSETTFLASDGESIEVTFDVKKNTTYWIKADPESSYSTIEFDGDIVQTESR